jgi:TonB family protein
VASEGKREIQREEGKVLLVGALKPGVYDDNQEGITEPKLTKRVEFVRPPAASDKYTPAIVVLGLVITREGVPTDIKVIKSGGDALDTATIDAISQFRWEPARLDGKPVDFRSTFTTRWGVDKAESAQESQPASTIPEPDEPPAPTVTGSKVFKMGHKGIAPPKIVSQVPPEYPDTLKAKGIQGRVVLALIITDEGTPSNLKVLKSDNEGLNQAALDAVNRWRWEPPLLDGKAVSVEWIVTLNFRLS